jgi:hypothetical protein
VNQKVQLVPKGSQVGSLRHIRCARFQDDVEGVWGAAVPASQISSLGAHDPRGNGKAPSPKHVCVLFFVGVHLTH